MEITLNKLNNTEGVIKIKLTEGDYQPHVEEKVRDYSKKANLKGFRQGKVPTAVIKRMFGKSILVDEINGVLSQKLTDYIRENNLKILGEPLPNHEATRSIDWDNQKDFEFEYQVGMVDDFTYDLSKSVKVKSYPITVDERVIDDTVEDLRKRFGNVTYPEASGKDDTVFGKLVSEELKDGEPAVKREYSSIALSEVKPAHQAKFTGVKKEDVISFSIEDTFVNAEALSRLLGVSEEEAKAVKGTFKLTVSNITHTEPAEIGQELFDRTFGKDAVSNADEFRSKIRETISENYQRESQHFLDHHIEDQFIANTSINLPDTFLKSWLKVSSQGKLTDDVIEQEFNEYKRGLKWDLVKNRIAEDAKINVETADVREKAKELIVGQFGGQAFAEQIADRLDGIIDNYLQHENGQNFMKLYQQLRTERIVSYIKSQITIEEQPVTVEEFKRITAEHKH